MVKFDIIEYLSGLTSFTLDKAVLNCIALDRGVIDVEYYSDLDTKTKDLLFADVLYAVYYSPNTWASKTNQHGGFMQNVGSQNISSANREALFNRFYNIYKKYDDPKLLDLESGFLQWL
jgi:hypothetical protein